MAKNKSQASKSSKASVLPYLYLKYVRHFGHSFSGVRTSIPAMKQYGIVEKAMNRDPEGILFGYKLSFAPVDHGKEACPP